MRTSLIVHGIAVMLLGTAAHADDLKIALLEAQKDLVPVAAE